MRREFTEEEVKSDEKFTKDFDVMCDGDRSFYGRFGSEERRSEKAAAKGNAAGGKPAAEESAAA